jgi:hypothetical protein
MGSMKKPTVSSFIGERAEFDQYGGEHIWGITEEDGHQMIAEAINEKLERERLNSK